VFLALFVGVLWCVYAWFVVRFNILMRDYWDVGAAGKEISKEEGDKSPYTFFYQLTH
jgi:hypothetical protein